MLKVNKRKGNGEKNLISVKRIKVTEIGSKVASREM